MTDNPEPQRGPAGGSLPPPTPAAANPPAATPPTASTAVVAAPGRSGAVHVIANILWVVLAGFWLAIGYVIAGIIQFVTIIGIPFGIQSFKLAGYALWPFGRVVVQRFDRDAGLSCLGNAIWLILGGIWLALGHLVAGLVLCLTIIGIPFGIASFKLAGLALTPFGKQIVRAGAPLPYGSQVYIAV